MCKTHVAHLSYDFKTLRNLMAKASQARSGDYPADVVAQTVLNEALVPYELDEVTCLMIDEHDAVAFASISHLMVGDFHN